MLTCWLAYKPKKGIKEEAEESDEEDVEINLKDEPQLMEDDETEVHCLVFELYIGFIS